MDDEKEKSRSSILKPLKRRNPLGDIDVQVEEEDFPTNKTRRVSFASSNQIKKFFTDEDKNTIWDSTYEECIESSENTPSSIHGPHSTKSVIIAEDHIEITVNTVQSRIDDDELEFTPPVCSMNTLCVTKGEKVVTKIDATMEFTQVVSIDIDVAERRNTNETVVYVDGNDEMEFTLCLDKTVHDKTIVGGEVSIDEVEMSFTQPVLQNIQQNSVNVDNVSCDKSMEFTTAINNLQLDINGGRLDATDMEFTTAINNVLVARKSNDTDNELQNEGLNNRKNKDAEINISVADMEFTIPINNVQIDTLQSNNDVQTNQEHTTTINDEDLKDRNINISNRNVSDVNMEFTATIDQQQTKTIKNKASNTITVHSLLVHSNIDQQQNKMCNEDTSRNISSVNMELDITSDDKLNTLQKVNDENVPRLRNENLKNNDTNLIGRNRDTEASNDVDITLKYSANNQTGDTHCEILNDGTLNSKTILENAQTEIDNDNPEHTDSINHTHFDKSQLSDVALLGPSSNDPSLLSLSQFALGNITSNDDTEQLINYQLNEKNQTKSDLSRVAAGDLIPSFSKLRNMPLGEYNSNSFHVSLNDVLDAAGSKLNVPSDRIKQESAVKEMSVREGTIMDLMEITDDTNRNLCDTQPPEELLEITNSINISEEIQESLHSTTISINIDNDSVLPIRDVTLSTVPGVLKKQPTESSNDQVPLLKRIRLPKYDDILKRTPFETTKSSRSLKDLCDKLNDLITSKVEDCLKLSDPLKNPVAATDSNYSSTEYSDLKISSEQTSENYKEFFRDDAESEKSIDLKLKDLEESNKKYWQLLSIDNLTYKFATLFQTIFLTVNLEENSDEVKNFEIEKKIGDGVEPEALYAHKIFCDKLSPKCIKAALGDKYDLRSLLDFIKETMHKLLNFLKEYDLLFNTYGLMMDKNFRVEFSVIKINLVFAWKFTINMLELNYITDKTVEYYAKVGSINDREIKQCIEKCPTGTSFIKAFVENIYDLVSRMESAH